MFQRYQALKQQRDERGFTLIELLVVILIIAILAAIAIPVFLAQRQKGWQSQVESALKNAATAQESYLVANDEYATTEAELESEGFKKAADVTALTITRDATGSQKYCMVASHDSLTDDTAVSSDSSEPTGPNSGGGLDGCTAGVKS